MGKMSELVDRRSNGMRREEEESLLITSCRKFIWDGT
jgi:hypothetical protein